MKLLFLLILVGGVSWVFTALLRKYALSSDLLDVPNERSSHSNPTPRGGGVSIVVTFLFGLVFFLILSLIELESFYGFAGAGLLIAILGFVDDHSHIPARWRLLGHFSAVSWLVFWLGGLPSIVLFGMSVDPGPVGQVLIVIVLVWLLNLYNFMDGIDGIAGVEALSSTLVVALLFLYVGNDYDMALLNLLLFAAVAGFLLWNFPPAKIFMGDAGSGFLGLMMGALAIYSSHIDHRMIWVWAILLGVFVVDATYTLVRRLLRGDKVYEAHRSHAYQFASRKYSSHTKVTISVLLINILWLAPWAVSVALNLIDGALAMLLAYIPLLFLAWKYHAGELER